MVLARRAGWHCGLAPNWTLGCWWPRRSANRRAQAKQRAVSVPFSGRMHRGERRQHPSDQLGLALRAGAAGCVPLAAVCLLSAPGRATRFGWLQPRCAGGVASLGLRQRSFLLRFAPCDGRYGSRIGSWERRVADDPRRARWGPGPSHFSPAHAAARSDPTSARRPGPREPLPARPPLSDWHWANPAKMPMSWATGESDAQALASVRRSYWLFDPCWSEHSHPAACLRNPAW